MAAESNLTLISLSYMKTPRGRLCHHVNPAYHSSTAPLKIAPEVNNVLKHHVLKTAILVPEFFSSCR